MKTLTLSQDIDINELSKTYDILNVINEIKQEILNDDRELDEEAIIEYASDFFIYNDDIDFFVFVNNNNITFLNLLNNLNIQNHDLNFENRRFWVNEIIVESALNSLIK